MPRPPVGEATATFPAKPGEPETFTRLPSIGTDQGDSRASVADPRSESGFPAAPLGYELLRKLGRGGMGDVYLARDLRADRVLAVKFLRAAHDPVAVERFLTEVRALAHLDHPGIVRVLAHDFDRSVPFFAMPYAPGGTLASRVEESGPLDPREAAARVSACARAVHAAHEAGVVHRDLKPSNVLLTAAGVPVVSDFGLAKRLDADSGLTTLSGAIGTPGFMPPEQVSRRRFGEVGVRADVYGLGATLYHLLTGRAPLVGETAEEVIRQIPAVVPARPRSLRPEVPPGVEAVVMKCLEKRPEDRFATAAELADELDRCVAGEEPATPLLTRWRRFRRWGGRNALQLTAAGVLAAVAVGLVVAGRATAPVPPSPDLGPVAPPDPAAEKAKRLEAIRADLRAGRPVTLVAEKGRPAYHQFLLEPNSLAEGDGPCAFNAFRNCLLELLPDPGIERYQLSLELQHRDIQAAPQVPGQSPQDYVGFYFGYAAGVAPSGTTVHQLFAVAYKDYDLKVLGGLQPGKSFVRFWKLGFVHRPESLPSANTSEAASLAFATPPKRPGPWRRVVADVSPDRVRVRWGQGEQLETVIDWDGDRTRREYLHHRQTLAKSVPGAETVLPAWTPRLPFGVISSKAAVAVRSVVITPTR